MTHTSTDINKMIRQSVTTDDAFPCAPSDWTQESAREEARREGLALSDDHWETVRALQSYYAHHDEDAIHLRTLHDALDEHFHQKGGLKYLYTLFPGGPIAQSCRLAGLQAPFMASDQGFGSVA